MIFKIALRNRIYATTAISFAPFFNLFHIFFVPNLCSIVPERESFPGRQIGDGIIQICHSKVIWNLFIVVVHILLVSYPWLS